MSLTLEKKGNTRTSIDMIPTWKKERETRMADYGREIENDSLQVEPNAKKSKWDEEEEDERKQLHRPSPVREVKNEDIFPESDEEADTTG